MKLINFRGKTMHSRWIFVLLGMVLITAGCRPGAPSGPNGTAEVVSDPALERSYERSLHETLEPVWDEDVTPETVLGAKEQALELAVPQTYLDLHLQVVVAISQLETGLRTSDTGATSKGRAALEQLAGSHPWLK